MYRDVLIATYKGMPEIPLNQWPPVTKALYINLALITTGDMRRDDLFSRGTVRGTADDILKQKAPIAYVDVFPTEIGTERAVTLIEGRPGCGKTTLITKVSRDWAELKVLKNVSLFILVHLRRFMGKADLTVADMIGIYCKNNKVVQVLVETFERTGGEQVCFALDGLDEYSSQMEPGKLIHDMIHGYRLPNASILITSRPAGAHRLRRNVKQNIEIIGFMEDEIAEYITSYYSNNPGKAASLIRFLRNHPNVSHMCYLPLQLAMVAFLYEQDEDLPDTETEMYNIFTLQTLHRALVKEVSSYDIELHEINDLSHEKKQIFNNICRLAFEATHRQKQVFTGREILKEKVLPVVPSKDDFDSLGFVTVDRQIAERALPTKTFSFLHLTLQEFLSASYLFRQCTDFEQLQIIAKHGGKIHMRMVWKFYCGLACSSSIFIESFDAIAKQNISNRLAVLHMMHCAFESQNEEACSHLLEHIHGSIDVKDITLNPHDCSVLGYLMTNAAEKVVELDLSYCHLGPSGIEAIAQHLQQSLPNLRLLRLRARIDFYPLGSKGAFALLKFLERLPNLGELRLYGNELQTNNFQALTPLVASMKNIHTLILSRNCLNETTGHLLSEILGNLPLLHTFYNSYNPIKDEGLATMMPGLLKSQNLKILGLRRTSLTEGAGKLLQDVLKTLQNLKWLELYQNRLRDMGVVNMLPGLYEAKALQQLSLVENDISDSGAIALAGYVSATKTLQQFRVYYNNMSDKGKIALRRAVLGRPAHITELKLAGRKKKPFIDKKNAQRFQLVARSQRDPLCGDAEETQYVLKPTEAAQLSREEQLEEQHKYGIHFSDDYDYLQHLKEPGTCSVMEPVTQEQDRSEQLPQELFGSDVVTEGQLQKVLPVAGPQPDWDPDIVAALERAELTSDPEEQLEDDFVLMANGGEPGVPVYVLDQHLEDDRSAAPWWQERVDFLPLADEAATQSDKSDQSDSEMEEEEEVLSDRLTDGGMNSNCERKSARFTEYSLSSSVVPRNDELTLLDERFEQFMGEYDDSQIGPLDDEGEVPSTIAPDQWLLEYAIQDFNKHHKDKLKQLDEEIAGEEKADTLEADVDSSGESEDGGSGGDMEVVQVEERGMGWGRKEQWDCESILSTYSNLYNHPTKITEPGTDGKHIKLSRKTGIPLGAVPGPLPKERHPKQAPTRRQPGESKDEKRTRKQAVKDERRQRRAEKKATKLAFKSEQLKQGLTIQHHTAAVV